VEGQSFDLRGDASHLAAYRDVDVVVSCAGPHYETELPAARAAVEAGVSYVSLCDEHAALRQVQSLDEQARRAGITIVSGCGLSPGITNLLIAHGAAEMDTVEAIDIALARSSAESTGDATARHLLYELSHEAPVIRDRQNGVERSGSSPKLVYFPDPVGWVETYRCGHPEVVTLPDRYPGLDSLQFRLGLAEKITMDTARAFTATPLAQSERARRLFVTLTKPARPFIDRLPPRGPSWTAARVDIKGTRDGNQTTTSLAVVDKLLNFASVPLTLAALRLGAGEVSGPGVLSPEDAFDVPGFLRALTKRGIGVAVLEPAPV
jgi:lysine 6-dehydrogenase